MKNLAIILIFITKVGFTQTNSNCENLYFHPIIGDTSWAAGTNINNINVLLTKDTIVIYSIPNKEVDSNLIVIEFNRFKKNSKPFSGNFSLFQIERKDSQSEFGHVLKSEVEFSYSIKQNIIHLKKTGFFNLKHKYKIKWIDNCTLIWIKK